VAEVLADRGAGGERMDGLRLVRARYAGRRRRRLRLQVRLPAPEEAHEVSTGDSPGREAPAEA